MKDRINVPELRFKGFEGEWEEKRLGDVVDSLPSKKHQIKNAEILTKGKYEVVDQGYSKIAGYSNNAELLFTSVPVVIFGDHTTEVKFRNEQFVVGADGTKLLKFSINGDNLFLFYNILKNNVQQSGYKRHFTDLKEKNLSIPNIEEQTRIATFFALLDNEIESIEKKIELLEKRKKGLMQRIFSQELRFLDENGEDYPDWVERRLGDLLIEDKERVKEYDGNKQISVKLKNGGVCARNMNGSESNSFPSLFRRHAGEFIYGIQNFHLGAIGIIPLELEGYFSSSFLVSFKILEDLNVYYLEHYFKLESNYKKFENKCIGTGSKLLYPNDFLSESLLFPCISEQQKIATFLSKLDEEITDHHERLSLLKERKQGLMQRVFI